MGVEPLSRGSERPVLDDAEQAVMDHILAAMQGIQDLGLRLNQAELAQAVHVLQSFVIQHMLQRLAPDHWGEWFQLPKAQHSEQEDTHCPSPTRRGT